MAMLDDSTGPLAKGHDADLAGLRAHPEYAQAPWFNLDHVCVRSVKKWPHFTPQTCTGQKCSDCPFPRPENSGYSRMMDKRASLKARGEL